MQKVCFICKTYTQKYAPKMQNERLDMQNMQKMCKKICAICKIIQKKTRCAKYVKKQKICKKCAKNVQFMKGLHFAYMCKICAGEFADGALPVLQQALSY